MANGRARRRNEEERQRNVMDMTPDERWEWNQKTPSQYGPGTIVGQSGRVFLMTAGRGEGTFNAYHAPNLTQELMERRNAQPSTPREPAGRTAERGGRIGRRSGGGGSTTLLTAEGLGNSQGSDRRTLLGV